MFEEPTIDENQNSLIDINIKSKNNRSKPSQEQSKKMIASYETELEYLKKKRNSGLTNENLDQKIQDFNAKLTIEKKKLQSLMKHSIRQKKYKESLKEKFKVLKKTRSAKNSRETAIIIKSYSRYCNAWKFS